MFSTPRMEDDPLRFAEGITEVILWDVWWKMQSTIVSIAEELILCHFYLLCVLRQALGKMPLKEDSVAHLKKNQEKEKRKKERAREGGREGITRLLIALVVCA